MKKGQERFWVSLIVVTALAGFAILAVRMTREFGL